MYMKSLIPVTAALLLLAACGQRNASRQTAPAAAQTAVPDMHDAENALDYQGTYTGVFPAADVPGIAVTLTIGQLKDFFGLTYPPDTVTVETTEKLAALVGNFSTVNWQACLVGVVCLAILFLWPRVTERVPSSLVALLAGIALVSGLGLEVSTIGDLYVIDSALPTFHMPHLSLELFRDQFANGVTIAILAAIESLLSCVVADSMISGHHRANMELVAQGVGNIASVLFGGIPATGAIARTAANVKAGGRTPIAGMVHALVLIAVLAFLMPYAALIPMPTIAAILLYVAYGMSGWRNFAHLCRTASKGAVATLVLTFVLTIVFDLVVAIGVGMLIDYRAFFRDWESIEVALVMIALITLAKFLAAYFTQKTFRLSNDQRTVIFGLSSAHVAATLAAVMVGYNVILGHTADGEPIRLLSESVLNGTILMILATCTVSTFATQRGAHNIAMRNAQDDDKEPQEEDHILIPLANEQTAYELVCLSMTLKKAKERNGLYALNAIDNKVEDPNLEKQGRKLLDMAAQAAASADNYMQQLLRYDVNIANAIVSVVKERNISDIVMGMHHDRTPGGSGIGRMAADLLGYSNVTTFFYHPEQPLTTVKRHLVIVPEKAEKEAGFQLWMQKLRNLAENSSARIVFYAPASTMQYLRPSRGKRSSKAEYVVSDCWDDLTALTYETKRDDCLWVVMSRRDRLSYHPAMSKVPGYMEQFFAGHSFVLIYPVQAGDTDNRYL